MRISIFCHVACAGTALLFSGILLGQKANNPEFEVASIRPTALSSSEFDQRMRSGQLRTGERINGSRAEYIYMTLRQLIAAAYELKSWQVDGPEWIDRERFDAYCKMAAGSRREDVPRMLQSLLTDRFKLVAHREMKEQDVKALIISKDGVSLRKSPSETSPNRDGTSDESPGGSEHDVAKRRPGSTTLQVGAVGMVVMPGPDNSSIRVEFSRMTMADLANLLGRANVADGRKVVDRTGLSGQYDIVLEIPMAELGGANGIKPDDADGYGRGLFPSQAASDPGSAPTLQQSLKSLGLELRNQRAQVEHVVIEHVDKMPTEN